MNSTLNKPETKARSTNGGSRLNYLSPAANIREDADGYVVEVEMPGVTKDGLDVTVENGELTLVGRRTPVQAEGRLLLYRESRGSDFRRVFELDSSIDAGRISAKIDQGVLTVHLPKSESVKPRKIAVS